MGDVEGMKERGKPENKNGIKLENLNEDERKWKWGNEA